MSDEDQRTLRPTWNRPPDADISAKETLEPRLTKKLRRPEQALLKGLRGAGGKGRGRAGKKVHKAGNVAAGWRTREQRAVVKARVVKSGGGNAKQNLKAHLRYLSRSGVGRDGQEVKFGTATEQHDREGAWKKVSEWAEDPHHFRFIVSPERGAELDLDKFTSALMKRVEHDLSTELEWLTVSHYNTDNPHVHLLVRGAKRNGQPLLISREYISRGLRESVEREATIRLGARRQEPSVLALGKQIRKYGLTSLDRGLVTLARDSTEGLVRVNLPGSSARSWEQRQAEARLGRLQFLSECGLAEPVKGGQWQLAADLETILRRASNQERIEKELQSELGVDRGVEPLRINTERTPLDRSIVGEVLHRGVSNELTDQVYLAVAASDSSLRYQELSRYSEPQGFAARKGSVVQLSPASPHRRADEVIQRHASSTGVFDLSAFAQKLEVDVANKRWRIPEGVSIEQYLERYEVRCKSLVEIGVLEEVSPGQFRLPSDFLKRVELVESQLGKRSFVNVEVLSYQSITEQIRAPGASWLDAILAGRTQAPSVGSAFGQRVQEALTERRALHLQNGQEIGSQLYERLQRQESNALIGQVIEKSAKSHSEHPKRGASYTLERYELLSDGYYMLLVQDNSFILRKVGHGEGRNKLGEKFQVQEHGFGEARELRIRKPRAEALSKRQSSQRPK